MPSYFKRAYGVLSVNGLGDRCQQGFKRFSWQYAVFDARKVCVEGGKSMGASLPCLSSNNSIIEAGKKLLKALPALDFNNFSSQHKKSACALAWNVEYLAKTHGIERLGFLTLTFPDQVTDPREAQRRFNSLATNVLKERYVERIRVFERTKSKRIHYHLLVVMRDDIRTGFDFDQVAQRKYMSASKALKQEWAFWRNKAKAYGFGRTELLPVKSTVEGISRYVGKYISKHIAQRLEIDRGFRLVEYSRGARSASTRFSFVSDGSRRWRDKMAIFARVVGYIQGLNRSCYFEEFKEFLGRHWAHRHREYIATLPVVNTQPPLGMVPAVQYPEKPKSRWIGFCHFFIQRILKSCRRF